MTVIDDTVSPVSPVPTRGAGDFAGSRRLWSLIPRDLVERFRPHAAAMASAMVHEIRRAIPEYAQPLDGPVGEDIKRGVREAILCAFSELNGIPEQRGSRGDWVKVFHYLGRVEFSERGNLDCLQTAYRVGGRVAWRHLSLFAQRYGVSTEVICVCAEAVFAYVDEICTLSSAGFVAAQAEVEGSRTRHRRVLLERILSGSAHSPRELADLARSASWELPTEVTMVALSRVDGPLCLVSGDSGVLMDLDGPQPHLLLPGDTPLPDLAAEVRAAVGPKVSLADAATSLRWARRTLDLMDRGVVPDAVVQRWDEHLATMWLHSDEFLLSAMAARNLSPLDGLTPKQRSRMSETLLAWLKARGGAPDVAAQLGVHPQTARYRIRQLEELFGKSLDDPAQRFALEITLRAQQAAEASGDQLAARRATA
ncbi:PucR family transcriptional regulator [Amycolatopsis sp. CA-230715]|uniref:PucR family transcriptional regulator n=1 Tax=Amycolatopsis sp. CA-230715 TaxID=2745196 RepID=UPI001C00A6E3|nr:helix-turn-helix domain-containing protein [Amycolatopsis sp. CA-230715]QWF83751.1 hypothetical protein HUW46_07194 [Amycolatopsis sp. CA-230715]